MTEPLYLNEDDTAAAVSLSVATLQRLVREGAFPRPRRLSANRAGYLKREVVEWAEARPVSDLLPPRNAGRRRSPQGGRSTR